MDRSAFIFAQIERHLLVGRVWRPKEAPVEREIFASLIYFFPTTTLGDSGSLPLCHGKKHFVKTVFALSISKSKAAVNLGMMGVQALAIN